MTKFNAKVWNARMSPQFQITDENSLACYLSQFAHQGCGGAPEIRNGAILCTVCKKDWRWTGPLGAAIAKLPFKSLIFKAGAKL